MRNSLRRRALTVIAACLLSVGCSVGGIALTLPEAPVAETFSHYYEFFFIPVYAVTAVLDIAFFPVSLSTYYWIADDTPAALKPMALSQLFSSAVGAD